MLLQLTRPHPMPSSWITPWSIAVCLRKTSPPCEELMIPQQDITPQWEAFRQGEAASCAEAVNPSCHKKSCLDGEEPIAAHIAAVLCHEALKVLTVHTPLQHESLFGCVKFLGYLCRRQSRRSARHRLQSFDTKSFQLWSLLRHIKHSSWAIYRGNISHGQPTAACENLQATEVWQAWKAL